MRLLGHFSEEKEAHLFCVHLSKSAGIACSYEAYQDAETGKHAVKVWIQDEDAFAIAKAAYERFKNNPQDYVLGEEVPLAAVHPPAAENPIEVPLKQKRFRIRVAVNPAVGPLLTLTNFILFICVILFVWHVAQKIELKDERGSIAAELTFTPIEQIMMFDYPYALQVFAQILRTFPPASDENWKSSIQSEQALLQEIEKAPFWKGAFDFFAERFIQKKSTPWPPMFEKIREGEAWRIMTPCFLHGGFLHIFFNMAWLWVLGKQIEQRIGKWRMALLIVVTGSISNCLQYLMGGPFFLGFSGIIIGMAGFIWMRQRRAPWEGYPLQRNTALFVLIFVIAMTALEVFSVVLHFFFHTALSANIANTAHIIGGLTGLLLGKLPVFSRVSA